MKKKIFISAINGPIGYELVKYLKRQFYIIGSDINPNGLGKNICDKFYISPPGNSRRYLNFLQKISEKVEQIFLFADEELFNLSNNRKISRNILNKILISPSQTINLCNDKLKLKKKLKNNIKFPNSVGKKIIIKPKIGRGSKNQITIKRDKKELIKFFKKDKNFFVEEFIHGKEYTIDCLFDKQNNLLFALPRQRIVKSNLSIVGKIVKKKILINFVKKISKEIKFIGNVNIQVIIDNKNKIYLIDINPRVSGSIIFSIKSGFNPFLLANKILSNQKFIKPKNISYGKTFYRYWKTFD